MSSKWIICCVVMVLLLVQIPIVGDETYYDSSDQMKDFSGARPKTGTRGATTYVNENSTAIAIGNDLIELDAFTCNGCPYTQCG